MIELIPKKLIKHSIKVLWCYFGDQDNTQNYKIKLQKMETTINKWKYFKINLCERILFLKMYVISLVQYQIKAFAIPGRYLRQMNMLMFKYVWNSRWEIQPPVFFCQTRNWQNNLVILTI